MKYRSSEPKTEEEAHRYLDWAIHCVEQEECVNFRYAFAYAWIILIWSRVC